MCNGLSTAPGTEQDQHLAVILKVLIRSLHSHHPHHLDFLLQSPVKTATFPSFHSAPCGALWLPSRDAGAFPHPPLLGWEGWGCALPTFSGTLGGA